MPPTPRDGPEAESPRRARRWRRRLLAAGAVLVLLAVGLRVALPTLLERAVPWAAERYLGATARLENVDLGLVRGELSATGLMVFAPGVVPASPGGVRERPWLGLDRLSVKLAFRDLLSRRVRLSELVLEGPEVNLARDAAGSLGPRPAPPPAEAEAPEPEEEPGEPWAVWLERVVVRDPTASVADLTAPDAPLLELSLDEIALTDLRVEEARITLGDLGLAGPVVRVNHGLVTGGAGGGAPEPTPAVAAGPPATPEPAAPDPPESASPAPAGAAPRDGYRVERIDVEGAELTWVGPGGPLETQLSFRAEGVRAAPGETFPLRLGIEMGGGSLELEGRAGLDPLHFDGTLGWEALPIPVVLAATAPELLPWLRESRTAGALQLRVQLEPGPDGSPEPGLSAEGRAGVAGLRFADPEGQEIDLQVEAVEAELRTLRMPLGPPRAEPAPLQVELASLHLVEPHLEYGRPHPALDALLAGDTGEGVEDAGSGAADAAAEGAPEDEAAGDGGERGGSPVEVTIDRLELEGGRVRVRDATVEPRFAGALEKLSVQAQGVRWPDPRAESFTLSALAPDGAPIRIDAAYGGDAGSLTLDLERLALPPFDPYASSAAGYHLQGGDASLESEARLAGGRVSVENRLVLHRLDVEALEPGTFQSRFGMSLDLALALLRNRQGDIRLSVPVAFDPEGGGVNLGGVLASAFRQALVGALSAPLKLVGAVIPGGGAGSAAAEIDLQLVHAPGASVLDADQEDAVAGLRRLLRQRPALGALLVGRAGPDDAPALAGQILEARAAAGEELPELDEAGLLARRRIRQALAARAAGEEATLDPEDQAHLDRAVVAVAVPDAALRDLARERAEAARRALVEAGAPEDACSVGEPQVPATPGVRVELQPRESV